MTAPKIDSDASPATPIVDDGEDRLSFGAAGPASRSRAGNPGGRAQRTGWDGWRARWPVLLVIAWAALATADVLFVGVGSAASHGGPARSAVPASVAAPAPAAGTAAGPQLLRPASAVAFGPAGTATGDNPGAAGLAIDASTATAWHTNSYAAAALTVGTGLLIDMGRPVTITSVRLVLGPAAGADLQLLTSSGPDLSQLHQQASASDASGTLDLTTAAPQRARYLLIWFTALPPDSAGTFRASVYDVRIEGTP